MPQDYVHGMMLLVCLLIVLFQPGHCQGIITTIAGSSTSTGYSGDNGQATSATMKNPMGVTLDSSGYFNLSNTLYSLGFARMFYYYIHISIASVLYYAMK